MAGGKRRPTRGRFVHHLQMRRALGIQSRRGIRPPSRMRGKELRRGTWWDREQNCIAIEGEDFAQDTQEAGGDQFEFIPDSDEETGEKDSSLLSGDSEFVPETEPQEHIAVSNIAGPCANQGRKRLGTMLHEWRQLILEEEQEAERQKKDSGKEDMHVKDNIKQEMQQTGSFTEEMLHKENNKELAEHKASISDMSTDDEASWVQGFLVLRVDHLDQMDEQQGALVAWLSNVHEWEMKVKTFNKRLDDIQTNLVKHMDQIQKDAVNPEKLKATLGDEQLNDTCDMKRAMEMVALNR